MSFFYDLNKKLDSIRATPEVTHQQLNERDMSRAAKGYEKYGKQGMEALAKAGREGKALDPIRAKYDKYDKDQVNELSTDLLKRARDKAGMKYADADDRKDQKASDKHNRQDDKFNSALRKKQKEMDEGVMDTVKSVGKRVASGVNKLVGHGSDEDMRRDLQRKSGAPVTGKKPVPPQQVKEKLSPAKQKSFAALAPPADKITFADKIAGAKKEVDEMLGDVAAEAMRNALSPKQKKIDMNKNGKLDANDFAMLRKGAKPEMDEERSKGTAFDPDTPRAAAPKVGSIERGHKHDIKHTATGRMVTRRTDDQGNSVGADDDSAASGEKRGRGRPKGTKQSIGAKGPSGKSKLMTKEGEDDPAEKGEYDREGDMALDDIDTIESAANELQSIIDAEDNLPEWVQSKINKAMDYLDTARDYMAAQGNDQEPIAEKAVSKQQQKFMGMARAMQKGKKIKGASKELKKVAKTMKPKDTEDFAKTKHKGLPDKVKSKKKEEEVDESTTSGSVATSTAAPKSGGGMSFGKGIYDSMNRELEKMISESMSINMSDSTEGGKSLTITATDEDALKLGMLLKNAGLGGGDQHGGDMHSPGEEPCDTCGMPDCGCGDVQEAVDENSPDYPTNTEQADNNFGYAGGLNRPKTDVAGDGQSTVPVVAAHTQDEDALRRMMEMAGLAEAAKPDYIDLDKDGDKEESMKDAADDKEEDSVEESIQRMREMAGIKEAKKEVDEEKTDEGNKFAFNVLKAKAAGKKEADLDGDGDMEKVRESIFALNNQWKAYKG
jgi:hypothetical protein